MDEIVMNIVFGLLCAVPLLAAGALVFAMATHSVRQERDTLASLVDARDRQIKRQAGDYEARLSAAKRRAHEAEKRERVYELRLWEEHRKQDKT